jgi:hypothetical protein
MTKAKQKYLINPSKIGKVKIFGYDYNKLKLHS